ncbi:MAG: N-carbamoyl-D-amino-acid hydrolase [Alphaproteobacteria bacterium]
MARVITVAGAQMGPIARNETRAQVVERMIGLLRRAHERGAKLVVFPELALTTFFPRWYMEDWDEVDAFFEKEMPGPDTQRLFDTAREFGIGFYLGYAEHERRDGVLHRFNTSILVDFQGRIAGKYRKVHLPGHKEHEGHRPWQHLEKRYFEVGDLGFPVFRTMGGIMGMCLCNDRRWPETWRVMGMQGVELVMVGYNTPAANALSSTEPHHVRMLHNHITVQAGCYQNGTWAVSVAKAGHEDGCDLMGGSIIVAPSGEIVAQAHTLADELIVYDCDLDEGRFNKTTIFNFAAHRRPEFYGIITERAGMIEPD